MTPRPTRLLATPLVLLGAAVVSLARAQGAPDAAAAQALFEEGRARLARGDYEHACAMLEESRRIAPAPGTAYNLADCYAHLGRVASAWSLFRDVEAEERLAEHAARTDLARSRAAELEPSLPRVTVHVAARVSGLEVTRDGATMGPAQWEAALPMDPGEHVFAAAAPGKVAWRGTVNVGRAGERVTVTIPALEDAPVPPPAPPPPSALPSPLAPRDDGAKRAPWEREMVVVSAVSGAAFLIASGVTVGVARAEYDRTASSCTGATCRTADAVAERQEAAGLGNVATALGAVGAVGVVAAGIVWLTAPKHGDVKVGLGLGQITVGGAW
jgi:hypothetical protein